MGLKYEKMKAPERLRTSRDPCCKVPSPQSPFAMMDRHPQQKLCSYIERFSRESAERQTDRRTHRRNRFYYLDRVADAGGKKMKMSYKMDAEI